MQLNPNIAVKAPEVPEFVLLDKDCEQISEPGDPLIRPEETIDTQYYGDVTFYDGTCCCSVRHVAGAYIRLPGAVFGLDKMTASMPLFNLYCTVSFVTTPGTAGVLKLSPAQARLSVFYSAHELCYKAAEVYRALALHIEMRGLADLGDAGELSEMQRMHQVLNELPAAHMERCCSAWLCPADLTRWAVDLHVPWLADMADRLVVCQARPWISSARAASQVTVPEAQTGF